MKDRVFIVLGASCSQGLGVSIVYGVFRDKAAAELKMEEVKNHTSVYPADELMIDEWEIE